MNFCGCGPDIGPPFPISTIFLVGKPRATKRISMERSSRRFEWNGERARRFSGEPVPTFPLCATACQF